MNATVGLWKQTLAGGSFTGRTVQEIDAGGGTDSCWFANSQIAPGTAVTGGQWQVDANNVWKDDAVGWYPNAVTYYRQQGRAPCGFNLHQQMQIQCPDGSYRNYGPVNTLIGSFTDKKVTSGRAGQSKTKVW